MNIVLKTLKCIYQERKYIWISLASVTAMFFILYRLFLAKIADNSLRIYIMMSGYDYTYFSLLSFVIISVLFGIYLSLIIYKINILKKADKSTGVFGSVGVLIGAFGSGCPTCGAVLFGLFGAPLALMYFPFRGMELRILSIIILAISNYILIKNLNNSCRIGKT